MTKKNKYHTKKVTDEILSRLLESTLTSANSNKNKQCQVRLSFSNLTKEQQEHISKARDELALAGITFDTGFSLDDKRYDWELDWSLQGKIKVIFYDFNDDIKQREKNISSILERCNSVKNIKIINNVKSVKSRRNKNGNLRTKKTKSI